MASIRERAVELGDIITTFLTQLEGPYKWYVIAGIAIVLTALVTRFVFKTFKWFFLLLGITALFVAGFYLLTNLAGL